VLEGVAELAQVRVGGEDPIGPQRSGEAVQGAREAASVTPGGNGLVETASAWLITLSSSQEA